MLKISSLLTFKQRFSLLNTFKWPSALLISMFISIAAFNLADSVTRCFGSISQRKIKLDEKEVSEENGNIKLPTAYRKKKGQRKKIKKESYKVLKSTKELKLSKTDVGSVRYLPDSEKQENAMHYQDKILMFSDFQYISVPETIERRDRLVFALRKLGKETAKAFNSEVSRTINPECRREGLKFFKLKEEGVTTSRDSMRVKRFSDEIVQSEDYEACIQQCISIVKHTAKLLKITESEDEKVRLDDVRMVARSLTGRQKWEYEENDFDILFGLKSEFLIPFELVRPHFEYNHQLLEIFSRENANGEFINDKSGAEIGPEFFKEVLEPVINFPDQPKRFTFFLDLLLRFKWEYDAR